MDSGRASPLTVLAPAKINLSLKVTGRLANGYHLLDSLVAFSDIGDRLRFEAASGFHFTITGPFAGDFQPDDLSAAPDSGNLVVRAAHAMAAVTGRSLDLRLTLEKNLPLASGIGGGSADAAATVWGLIQFWDLPSGPPRALLRPASPLPWLADLLAGLGADVPVCFVCEPVQMRGVGERLDRIDFTPELPILLVNPGLPCPTAPVFRALDGNFTAEIPVPPLLSAAALFDFMTAADNDLTRTAIASVPEIAFILQDIAAYDGCRIARMSGSGATCFGLFDSDATAAKAADSLFLHHPDWWVRAGTLNSPRRY